MLLSKSCVHAFLVGASLGYVLRYELCERFLTTYLVLFCLSDV